MTVATEMSSIEREQREVSRGAVLRPLAIASARALSLHPLTVCALVALAIVFGMGVDAASDAGPTESGVGYSTWGAALFAWFMLLAANLTVARGKPADEIYSTTPPSARVRTAASLVALAAPAAAVMLLAIAFDVAFAIVAPDFSIARGAYTAEGVVVVARSLVLIVLMGSVGVAVARWVPHPVAGGVAFIASLQAGESPFHPMWGDVGEPLGVLGWQLAYAAGMTLVIAAIALSRHGVRRSQVALSIAGAALIIGRIAFA